MKHIRLQLYKKLYLLFVSRHEEKSSLLVIKYGFNTNRQTKVIMMITFIHYEENFSFLVIKS